MLTRTEQISRTQDSPPAVPVPRLRRLILASVLGSALFLLHSAGVISGALAPPQGYEPAWVLRNLDTPQYLTWLSAARDHVLLPDYHAPWQTEPALWQPLMLLAARSGLPALPAYYLLHLLLYISASYALLYAASVFCPGRQTWFAMAAIAAAVPFRLLGWIVASMTTSLTWHALFVAGLTDFGYETADGLTRGGVSNSPMLTVGTMFMLLAMTLLARYLETSDRKHLLALCGVTFLSGFVHPFEIFAIVPAAAFAMFFEKRLSKNRMRQWLAVAAAGFLGLTPYLALSVRSTWLRDTGEIVQSSFHPFFVLADYGIPCVLAVYLLLIRFRMPSTGDLVLRSWFITVPALLLVPGIPFRLHLMNGYVYCIGFLLVRRILCDPQILPLLQRSRKAAYRVLAATLAVAAIALTSFFVQVWNDGRRAEPVWLVSAVRPVAEPVLLDWIAKHTRPNSLVLSPPDLAVWVAGIPRPSFASHDFFSITYDRQRDLAERFYKGEPAARALLADFGVRVAVIPSSSAANQAMPSDAFRTEIGAWRVYEFPNATMKPYPGLALLDPTKPLSLRHRVFTWLGSQ